jgi:cytochrome P450
MGLLTDQSTQSATWDRKTLQPITLQDGTHISQGTYLSLPVSNIPADPAICQNPEEFDPFRFYKIRHQSIENASKHQFTSTDRYSLHFGYGRHACPGRFFACAELKAVIAWIIRNWDIRFDSKTKQRPINRVFGLDMGPDTRVPLEFKLRTGRR